MELCKRCKVKEMTLVSRKEKFCDDCFVRFVRGKQRKQMQDEKFKVKFKDHLSRTRLLLDFKNNVESYALFDILISMLSEQLTQGPKAVRGFDLVVALIHDKKDGYKVDLNKLMEFYTPKEFQRLGVEFVEVDPNDYVFKSELENLNLDLQNFEAYVNYNIPNKIQKYDELLSQIADKSTKEDISTILHKDMIIATAKKNNCSIIVNPNSMTQMSVEILSDTITGRGAEIPMKLHDAYIENLEVIYPMGDALLSEVKMYANVRRLTGLSKAFEHELSISDVSTKNKTVMDMVAEYFQTLEVEYPEVVSTVVKIGAKLANPSEKSVFFCELCKNPIYHDPKKWLEQITVPDCVPPQNEEEEFNLKRYQDSIYKVKQDFTGEDQNKTKLCYGCMVTLGVSQIKDFQWPQRATREEILQEYILSDEE